MLLPSGNDIAHTLAVDLGGGSQARFIGWMNDDARRLGMLNSHFSTPIGLDRPGNYSTAADLARLANAVLEEPLLASVVAERSARLADGRVVVNRDDLLFGRPWIIGLKTGNTADAGECLVGAARRDGTTVIDVVLGEPTVAARDADTLALLRAGLAAYRAERPVPAGVVYARVPVVGRPGERVRLFACPVAHAVRRIREHGAHDGGAARRACERDWTVAGRRGARRDRRPPRGTGRRPDGARHPGGARPASSGCDSAQRRLMPLVDPLVRRHR
jgi:D-alanyl-D-alanine carboxypeptidase (penicillin-binding protein 5/6)